MMDREAFEESLLDPILSWNGKRKAEIRELLGKEVARMVGYNQKNPHHCFDLFVHSLQTVRYVGVDSPTPLRIAAFFHDIGKPYVAKEKQGRLVYYGHAQKSEEITRFLLHRMDYSPSSINLICFYISHHDDFISWVLPDELYDHDNPYLIEITAKNLVAHINGATKNIERYLSNSIIQLWNDLLLLCYADVAAQSELVYKDGLLVDSREHKLKKINAISTALNAVRAEALT